MALNEGPSSVHAEGPNIIAALLPSMQTLRSTQLRIFPVLLPQSVDLWGHAENGEKEMNTEDKSEVFVTV